MSFLEKCALVFVAMFAYGMLVGGFTCLLNALMGDALWENKDFLMLSVPAASILVFISLLGALVAGYYSYNAGGGLTFAMLVCALLLATGINMVPLREDAQPRPESHRLSPRSLAIGSRYPGWTYWGRPTAVLIALPAGYLLARRRREMEEYEAIRNQVLGPRD